AKVTTEACGGMVGQNPMLSKRFAAGASAVRPCRMRAASRRLDRVTGLNCCTTICPGPNMKRSLFLAALLVGVSVTAHAQRGGGQNPFAPPQASLHYALDREYDLMDLSVDLDIDYAKYEFTGVATNTLA